MSQMRRGEKNPFYGRKHTPETRRRLAEILRINAGKRTYELAAPKIRVPSGDDLAYLAGIVDGEGSARFGRGRPFLAIYNSDPHLKRWLKAQTGISARETDRRGRVPGWTWRIDAARDLHRICAALLPLLIVKQADVQVVMDHLEQKYGERLSG